MNHYLFLEQAWCCSKMISKLHKVLFNCLCQIGSKGSCIILSNGLTFVVGIGKFDGDRKFYPFQLWRALPVSRPGIFFEVMTRTFRLASMA